MRILRSMRRRRGMMWGMRRKRRTEQWQGFLKSGEGPLKGGVRRHNAASWSYLLHFPALLLLAFTPRGRRADDSESRVAREAGEAPIWLAARFRLQTHREARHEWTTKAMDPNPCGSASCFRRCLMVGTDNPKVRFSNYYFVKQKISCPNANPLKRQKMRGSSH